MPAKTTCAFVSRRLSPAEYSPTRIVGHRFRSSSAFCSINSLTCWRISTRPPHCVTACRVSSAITSDLPAPVGSSITGLPGFSRMYFHAASTASA